jgi:hypothetical protein
MFLPIVPFVSIVVNGFGVGSTYGENGFLCCTKVLGNFAIHCGHCALRVHCGEWGLVLGQHTAKMGSFAVPKS